jgi:hypothetical protein
VCEGKRPTKDFPAFTEALVVYCVDDVDYSMAVIVVFWPDGPDPALSAEVPELEHGRGQSDLPGWRCKGVGHLSSLRVECGEHETRTVLAYCRGDLVGW